jgi:hypothetical protein
MSSVLEEEGLELGVSTSLRPFPLSEPWDSTDNCRVLFSLGDPGGLLLTELTSEDDSSFSNVLERFTCCTGVVFPEFPFVVSETIEPLKVRKLGKS